MSLTSNHCDDWRCAIASEAPRVFQIAMLLSGNREVAEAALIDSVETLSLNDRVGTSALAACWAEAVVKNIVQRLWLGSAAAGKVADSDALHPRLRHITELPALLRIIFALTVLLGYPFPSVAALIDVSKDRIVELLGEAVLLLAQKQVHWYEIKNCGTSP
jgi:hypothetical protein